MRGNAERLRDHGVEHLRIFLAAVPVRVLAQEAAVVVSRAPFSTWLTTFLTFTDYCKFAHQEVSGRAKPVLCCLALCTGATWKW